MDTIVRFADLRPDRWRNGGGTTREIAYDGTDPGNFAWRLSLADVEQPGAFSHFSGTERILTVVEGAEMLLDIEGQEHTMERGRPFHFSGDAAVTASLPAGPVRALNVIAHRGTVRADVVIQELTENQSHHVLAHHLTVVLSGQAVARSHGTETELSSYDTVRGTNRKTTEITGQGLLAVVSLGRWA